MSRVARAGNLTSEQQTQILIEIARTAQYSFELMQITVDEKITNPSDPTDIAFVSHTVYITNGGFDVTWEGNTYLALGEFLSVSDIEETGDLQVNTVNIGLSGVPSEILNLFFNYIYTNRRVVISRAYFNEVNLLIGAITIFDGRMDKPVLQDDPNAASIMGVECRNQWADFERKAGRHTNNDEQQAFFPGDKGFEYSSQVVQDIKWGG